MLSVRPRIAESTTSTGTNNLTLAGALPTCRSFNEGVGLNSIFLYAIEPVDANGVPTGTNFEIGLGYLSATTTLVRLQVLHSSNSNALVNLAAGTKNVYLVDPRAMLSWESDDFTSSALLTTGNISALAWGSSAAGTAANSWQSNVSGYPGILRLTTGATSGNNSRLHRGSSVTAAALIVPADTLVQTALIRIPDITSITVRFGLGQDISAANFGTAGMWVEFNSASSANWLYATRQASTGTPVSSTLAVVANTWYNIDIVHHTSGVSFFINNNLLGTITTNLPTTALQAGFIVQTATAAARSLDIDLYQSYLKPLGR